MGTQNVPSTNANFLPVLFLYSQVCEDTYLEKACYHKFLTRREKFAPDRLPPTEDATTPHSLTYDMEAFKNLCLFLKSIADEKEVE